ncbi:MAG: hypothetical protein AB7D33_09925 [Sphingobium sp.]
MQAVDGDNQMTGVRKTEIDGSATLLLGFLERNRLERIFEYPFGYSYPQNCCESVSLILTYLLEEKYGLGNVSIIKGSKACGYEHHFWVMVGDWTYDLTAHQFAGETPKIGVFADPLFHSFPDWNIENRRDFVDRSEVVAAFRNGVIPF